MELAYPVTHPAHPDYKPERFSVPSAPFSTDFLKGHPAYGGKNVSTLDSPDGMRAAHNAQVTDLTELAAVGSLPLLQDPETGEKIDLSPAQLAYVYAVRKGLSDALAEQVTREYNLTPADDADKVAGKAGLTPEDQAKAFIMLLGNTPERAQELLDKYGVQSVMQDRAAQS